MLLIGLLFVTMYLRVFKNISS